MIQIRLTKHNGEIRELRLSGHSGSAESGRDLVCAGVSSITYGLCNALDQLGSDCTIEVGENSIVIKTHSEDEKTQWILKTGEIQLRTVEEVYSDFVRIKTTEV